MVELTKLLFTLFLPVVIGVVVATSKGNMASRFIAKAQTMVTKAVYGKDPKSTATHFFDLKDKLIDGTEVSMEKYKGSVLCVVNVASY
mmetsp:Transcript_38430/g.78402  ORF Transcript_38430/g.78402 Transcript_38430/m.78402 type:complete len:88 (+) Transcript_38430:29-292(+)